MVKDHQLETARIYLPLYPSRVRISDFEEPHPRAVLRREVREVPVSHELDARLITERL